MQFEFDLLSQHLLPGRWTETLSTAKAKHFSRTNHIQSAIQRWLDQRLHRQSCHSTMKINKKHFLLENPFCGTFFYSCRQLLAIKVSNTFVMLTRSSRWLAPLGGALNPTKMKETSRELELTIQLGISPASLAIFLPSWIRCPWSTLGSIDGTSLIHTFGWFRGCWSRLGCKKKNKLFDGSTWSN